MIARARQSELLTATALILILGTAAITAHVGLSLALGAFVAGLLLAESEYRHHVEADIAPFRGILLGLFFMTVGMSLDLGRLPEELAVVAALVFALLAVKALVLYALVRLTRLGAAAAVRTALLLCQGGEFAFILFTLAVEHGVMPPALANLLIMVVGVTMAMTPGLAWVGRALARRMMAHEADRLGGLAREAAELEGHVVILGFGRVGQTVAAMLKASEIPYIGIDLEPGRVIEGRGRGQPVFYADASRPQVLRRANLDRACAAVVAVDNPANAVRVVEAIRRASPEVGVFARARDSTEMARLLMAGASVVVPDTLEASLQLGGQLLARVGMPESDVDRLFATMRTEGYGRLAEMLSPREARAAGGERPAEAPGAGAE
jgi:CPA2 family monovalent cation:H+ antiporter-2